MSDKTREDFEAWHEAEKVQPLAPYLDTYKNAHTRCRWEGYQAATQHSAARIAELEAEVQALRRDAERLDYLQCRGATVELLPGTDGFYPMRFRVGGLHAAVSENIRGAIDTAMAQGANHG